MTYLGTAECRFDIRSSSQIDSRNLSLKKFCSIILAILEGYFSSFCVLPKVTDFALTDDLVLLLTPELRPESSVTTLMKV